MSTSPLKDGVTLYEFLKRPEINLNNLEEFINLDYDDDIKKE